MKEKSKTVTNEVLISGYIDVSELADLNGSVSGETLKEDKNIYEILKEDINYRLEIVEGIDPLDVKGVINETLPDDFDELAEFAGEYIRNLGFEVKSADFMKYYENGIMSGYDYLATLNVKWIDVWNAFKARTTSSIELA